MQIFLIDADKDFERETQKCSDGVFIVEQMQDGCFGPVIRERPPRFPRLRERPPLAEYFAAREASSAKQIDV